ncbi:hypothetical protein JIR001_18760 [Polycladomyces abyssicola]|uniref:Uncharacterized protein n=1 Tax=Polycladomyces abyssicola TaxID=1125966 RepID=A0A8D5UG58_9BACL|nr:hypothetical protein [Polycladomyces abyssicola]BCU82093.1 hypothetical protein JIR001_18760 [Polycladomyces abyssicola]
MYIQFDTPHQYVFIHEHVRHLLLLWPKEEKNQLYVAEWKDDTLWLRYPGETYTETVWDQVEPFFFQRLKTEEKEIHAVLGATFRQGKRLYAMYYNRDNPGDDLYFFEVRSQRLHEIPDEEYENVVQAFLLEYPEYMGKEE